MNREILLERKEKKAISPIIATLLLILIAIAAGVVVYAYVIGFIGNSTSNTGNNTSIISIDDACVSATSTCGPSSGDGFYIVVRNVGSTTLSGNAAVYLTDITAGTTPSSTSITCAASGGPGSTFTCYATGALTNPPTAGDIISIKIVVSDGGAATTSLKAIG